MVGLPAAVCCGTISGSVAPEVGRCLGHRLGGNVVEDCAVGDAAVGAMLGGAGGYLFGNWLTKVTPNRFAESYY